MIFLFNANLFFYLEYNFTVSCLKILITVLAFFIVYIKISHRIAKLQLLIKPEEKSLRKNVFSVIINSA